MTETFVIVGCGSAKRPAELVPGTLRTKSWPAKDLYTSTYFRKKREFAEVVGDQWMILSAEHGLIPPGSEIRPYDTSIDDLDNEELDGLAFAIGCTLIEWIEWTRSDGTEVDRIVVLAGRRYLDPLRDRDVFTAGIEPRVVFQFQQLDLGGIGEQMAWLSKRIESADQHQTTLRSSPGGAE